MTRRPRRWTELVHYPEDGRREPIEPGCFVVVQDPDHEIPLALARVIAGPEYTHAGGAALGEVWTLHDGSHRPTEQLTRCHLASILEDATAVLAGIRRGHRPADSEALILRTHRAACLARRATAGMGDDLALLALVSIDEAIAEMERAWREMVRIRLPNLARCLQEAAACELARLPGWTPGEGVPHPSWPSEASDGHATVSACHSS